MAVYRESEAFAKARNALLGAVTALLAVAAFTPAFGSSIAGTERLAVSREEGIPNRTIPLQFGVNIHFVEPREKEIDMIADAGFRFIRTDFVWGRVERQKGIYDFTGYDQLVESLAKRSIRPLFILDYGNRHYDEGLAPHTDEGRAAFAKFAAAAAKRFSGKGILWEIWNEPNLDQFWKPKANVADYNALALAVCQAMREADPECKIVAPATSGIPFDFLEKFFQTGVLKWLDAVTVHPYRGKEPETVTPEYLKLRELIDKYAPPEKKGLPILSGEWGYSTLHFRRDLNPAEKQGQYLARQFLVNLMNDVRLSIWYDWHDDGPDPNEYEHNFGTVTHTYELKPAYLAARTLLHTLSGMRYVERVPLESPDDYLLLFRDDVSWAVAAWTTAEAHSVSVPVKTNKLRILSMTGETRDAQAKEGKFEVQLSGKPQYIVPLPH
jgi:hypothetical protein